MVFFPMAYRKTFGKALRALYPLELVHSDISAPMNVKAHHGASYFLTFIDEHSRFNYVYLISYRFEALDCFKCVVALVENQTDKKLKILRIDPGHEYLSHQFQGLCEEKRICRQLKIPRIPQQNGVVERWNRTLLDIVKSMMAQANLLSGGMTENELRDVNFIENEFSNFEEITPSFGKGEELETYHEIAKDSGSDLPPSERVLSENDSLGSQLRRSERGSIHHRCYRIDGECFMCTSLDLDEPASYEEALVSPHANEWTIAIKD
ncbi:uncharacterized protein LOC114318250 [Camellia sinensis]|uniref:uncharacterized protein LOC114318250 n=1 Tax=Camellia sinensis TaxID=4442 RepID=UPI0010367481|nr:uncharacterized protein LOC114318250 [Camellia sinensis]